MAAKNRRILENGFRLFAERGIETVKLTDIAKAAGIGIASLYRYYSSKPELVLAISTWAMDKYIEENARKEAETAKPDRTGAQMFDYYMGSYLDLYSNHKDLLRFNQFFNVYLFGEEIPADDMKPYTDMIKKMAERFGKIYEKGKKDGTLRTDISMEKMFSATVHLMLAAITRYAVGLVYNEGTDVEEELLMLKEMMVDRFTIRQ